MNAIQPLIKQYEEELISSVEGGKVALNQATVDEYFARARKITRDWSATLDSLPPTKLNWFFRCYWQGYNKLNGIR